MGETKKIFKKQLFPLQTPVQTASRFWNCHACTYRNRASVDICEMCAKSRQFAAGQSAAGQFDSESGGCTTDDYETTNGDEEFDEHSLTDDERQMVVCAKCTLKNKVKKFRAKELVIFPQVTFTN